MRKLLIVTMVMMVVLVACGTSSPASEVPAAVPTNGAITEAPVLETELPAPTPEPPTSTPEPPLDYFTEDFNTAPANWTNWYFPPNNTIVTTPQNGVTIEVRDGFLVFEVAEMWRGGVPIYDGHEYTDVRVDARVMNDGHRTNYSTLMCRFSEQGWYEFNIDNGGQWWINVAIIPSAGAIKFDTIHYGGSTSITTDINEIGFSCIGDMLTGYINGKELKGIKDTRLVSGKVGIQAGAGNVVPVLISFDWFKVSQP